MVSRRASKLLVLFTALAVLFPSVGSANDASRRLPNIVYILADDLGYGDLRCYNRDSKIPTPHMDRLAAEGMRFLDAHSGASVCTPTRYGILTGRYAWRTPLKTGGLFGYSAPLINTWRITVPSLLKRHGYQTECVGKWHLGLDWTWHKYDAHPDFSEPIRVGPLDYGFDYFFGIAASADMPPFIFIENNFTVGLPTESVKWFKRHGLALPRFEVVDVMPTLARKAVERIQTHAQDTPGKPFFLYFPLTAPHIPVVPPDFVAGKSQADRYGDFVYLVDWTVGQVMESLDAHGLAENTMVILTSDNGGRIWVPADERHPEENVITKYNHLTNGHLRGRKSDIWEGGHRIPFIARWPGSIEPGTTSGETICLNDLLATCAAVVGETLPDNAGEDSYNILPALLGEEFDRPIREATVHHSNLGMFAIRLGPWKLIFGRGSGGHSEPKTFQPEPGEPQGQLYNMDIDPNETRNLYKERRDVVRRLTALFEKYKQEGRSRPSDRQQKARHAQGVG